MHASAPPAVPRALRAVPLVAVGSVGYVLFAPAAVPDALTSRFGIGYTAFGLLTSAPLLSVVLAQAPSGYLTARYSTTRILLVAAALHMILTITLDFAHSFLTLLALRTFWGIAGGVILTVGATHIARLHQGANETRQQGLYGGVLTLGGAIAFILAPPLLTTVRLIGLHSPGALFGVLAIAACWRYRHETATNPPHPQPISETASMNEMANISASSDYPNRIDRKLIVGGDSDIRQAVTHPVVIVAAFCYIASLGSYVTLSTFITAYFATLGVGGPLNASVLFVATTGRVAGGVVAGRWELHDWTSIAAAMATAVVAFGVLAFGRSLTVAVVFPLIAMLAVSFPFGAIYGMAADTTVSEGAALATVIAAGNLGALLLPVVTGAIRDATGGYSGGFVLLGVLNAIAAVGVVLLQRLYNARSPT